MLCVTSTSEICFSRTISCAFWKLIRSISFDHVCEKVKVAPAEKRFCSDVCQPQYCAVPPVKPCTVILPNCGKGRNICCCCTVELLSDVPGASPAKGFFTGLISSD